MVPNLRAETSQRVEGYISDISRFSLYFRDRKRRKHAEPESLFLLKI